MGSKQRAACSENDELVDYMRKWWIDIAEKNPKAYTENRKMSIQRAFTNVCHSKTHIKTLKDFHNIKGVGGWFVKELQGFFNKDLVASDGDGLRREGKNGKEANSYLPQKHTAAYALLITLYRRHEKGIECMSKQELIDAAEASGLARVPIAPEKGKGKLGKPGSSRKEWYSGWSAMGMLIKKKLVEKESCPAKYNLTPQGREAAYDCMLRSDMFGSAPNSMTGVKFSDSGKQGMDNLEFVPANAEVELISVELNTKGMRDDVPVECLDRDYHLEKFSPAGFEAIQSILSMPPLGFLEKFEDTYEVVLILDDREYFIRSKTRNLIDEVRSQNKIQILVRRLPVGDGIWIARHKHNRIEYVLDFIAERKSVDDLRSSIKDNRYKDQKLRLLDYVADAVDKLSSSVANSLFAIGVMRLSILNTPPPLPLPFQAKFPHYRRDPPENHWSNEILDGFDVQRTKGLSDTLKRYEYLTLAITDYYKLSARRYQCESSSVCPTYREFITKCQDLDKMTVSDVFATQLMQVPHVTEEVAVAVLDCYPTLYSLARAYSLLDGDTHAQEELLTQHSKNVINAAASKNIFQLVWCSS